MRPLLDKLYQGSGILSGFCLVAMCCLILARVIGRWMGIVVPSSDDFAGFLLAAGSFLALAYTFRCGGHIRVNLLTSRLTEKVAIYFERFVLTIATALVLYLAYQLCYMVWESWDFEEVSSGYVEIPIWIVQLPMAIGMVIFAISIADQAVCSFLYNQRIPLSEEESLIESSAIEFDAKDTQSQSERGKA